ncbi:MAG: hypothetical protein AAB804_01640 [Patescibacteria group bacterium]
MRMIFSLLVTLLLAAGMVSQAHAICLDKQGVQYQPAAVADVTGTVVVNAPTGEQIRVSGFAPGAEVCRNLLFRTAIKKCPSGEAVLDDLRNPRFCKGVGPVGTCVHIACKKKG